MAARYILAVVSLAFAVAAALRIPRDGGLRPQSRTWLMVAATFAAVSIWLFTRM